MAAAHPNPETSQLMRLLALLITGIAVTILAWRSIDPTQLKPDSHASDRRRSLVLFGVVAFIFLGRWLAGIIDLLGGDPTNGDYLENPTAYLLIGVLDLGIIVPAALVTAVTLRRHHTWARIASYAIIGWFTLVPSAVAAMAIVMTTNDDPNASTSATIVFIAAAIVFTTSATWLYLHRVDARTGRRYRGQAHAGYLTAAAIATVASSLMPRSCQWSLAELSAAPRTMCRRRTWPACR